jgi:hypothetical protein
MCAYTYTSIHKCMCVSMCIQTSIYTCVHHWWWVHADHVNPANTLGNKVCYICGSVELNIMEEKWSDNVLLITSSQPITDIVSQFLHTYNSSLWAQAQIEELEYSVGLKRKMACLTFQAIMLAKRGMFHISVVWVLARRSIPTASVTIEQSFSAWKRIHTYLCSIQIQKRLSFL